MVRLRGVRCATALTALAAVIVGAATMSGVAAADPTPVPPPSSIQTVVHDSPLQSTLIVYSASMNRAIPVTVLHPKAVSYTHLTLPTKRIV